jgi:hypothetical protein
MASTDARPVPEKSVAYRLYLEIRKTDGSLITSWTGADTELSLDGGAFADATNEITEIGTSGIGYIDLTSGEMGYDSVIVKSTVTNTGALTSVIYLYPEEAGDIRSNATQIGGQTVTASGGITFPAATLASTTNITGGTITTVSGNVTGNVGGNVTGSVGSISGVSFPTNFASLAITAGGAVTAGTVSDKTGYSLAAAGFDAITVETGINPRQALSLIAAAVGGVLSGAATTTIVAKGAGVATTRITATVDADGNRSALTLNLPS